MSAVGSPDVDLKTVKADHAEACALVGIGIDLIEISRLSRLAENRGTKFLSRVFTEAEMAEAATKHGGWNSQYLAGRWAAKEAVSKAIGTGFSGFGPRSVEITRGPSGEPMVTLHRGAGEAARRRGIEMVLVSVSHCRDYAIAQAVALGRLGGEPR